MKKAFFFLCVLALGSICINATAYADAWSLVPTGSVDTDGLAPGTQVDVNLYFNYTGGMSSYFQGIDLDFQIDLTEVTPKLNKSGQPVISWQIGAGFLPMTSSIVGNTVTYVGTNLSSYNTWAMGSNLVATIALLTVGTAQSCDGSGDFDLLSQIGTGNKGIYDYYSVFNEYGSASGPDYGVPERKVWVDDDYTSGGGNDGHTWGVDAFDNIQEAIDSVEMVEGLVHVAAGTYYENITMREGVEVLGAGQDVTTIDGGCSGSVVTGCAEWSNGSILDGFRITNGTGTYNSTYSSYGGGGVYFRCSGDTISNCKITGNSADGGAGIIIYNCSPTIINCIIYGNSAGSGPGGGGIFILGDSSGTFQPVVTNCTISGNSAVSNGGGVSNQQIGAASVMPVITNCISYSNTPNEIISFGTASPVVTYSDIQGGYPSGTGNLSVDPLFGTDYHLQAGSPCKDTGTATSAPADDIDGESRPQDSGYDIGADEFYDSDGDDIPDSWEWALFDDLDQDETTSDDTDTLTDLEEFEIGTNPKHEDTDGDGVNDDVEVLAGTDPLDPDDFPVENIPTVSEWGMIILALLLITAGMVVIRRREEQ